MTKALRTANQALQAALARVLGAIDSAHTQVLSAEMEARSGAEKIHAREQAIARNRAAQAVIENAIRARDRGTGLQSGTEALRVAEYVTIGTLTLPGSPMGVNEAVEVPLTLPLIGNGNIIIDTSARVSKALTEQIVWHALHGTAPGQLDILGYDPKLTSVLAPFSGLRKVSDDSFQLINRPEDLERSLERLVAHVQRVGETLRGTGASLADFRRGVGHPVERFQLVVLSDYPEAIDEKTHRQILTLAKAGPLAGLSFLFAISTADLPEWWQEADLAELGPALRENDGYLRWDAHPGFTVVPSDDGGASIVAGVDSIAALATSTVAPSISFDHVQPIETAWTHSSADGLQFAIGLTGQTIVEVMLGDTRDQRHNILITGAVGQGKSNLLKVIIHSLAQRYSPEELELYLLDFKEGVTLYPMAPTPEAPDFLPHARVLGLESDREFGLAVLLYIESEFNRRSRIFRAHGDSISAYRAAVPHEPMPRIVVIVDEFHMLFDPNDKTAERAAQLLEAIARKGRAYGIHLILASQTISGVEALMTREGGIFAQFPIRLALKNAIAESYATLGQGNDAAARLRVQGEAVLNLNYGHTESNQRVVIAHADDSQMGVLRHAWWECARGITPPMVFEGSRRMRVSDAISELRELRKRAGSPGATTAALIGYPIDLSGRSIAVPLTAEPGRNIALLGAGEEALPSGAEDDRGAKNTAIGVLQTAALSLALQHPEGDVKFVNLEMVDTVTLNANGHKEWISAMATLGYVPETIGRQEVGAYLQQLATDLNARADGAPPVYVLGFGLDRATSIDTPDMFAHRPAEDLQQILRAGPAKRIHMLAWWANAATFKSHIGFGGEGFIDAMLMLRIDQSTVQELLSSPFITWSVQDNRGLLSDRTQLAEPTAIIPFSPITTRDASTLRKTDWQVDDE